MSQIGFFFFFIVLGFVTCLKSIPQLRHTKIFTTADFFIDSFLYLNLVESQQQNKVRDFSAHAA